MIEIVELAKSFGNRVALISNNTTYSYQDLLEKSENVAFSLLDGSDDLDEARITFLVPPSFEYTAVQWGVWRAGGIAVPLCVLHPPASLEYVLKDTQSKKLIVHDEYLDKVDGWAQDLGIEIIPLDQVFQSSEGSLPDVAPSRRAMILYTSGTTSDPKGVVTTHSNVDNKIKTLVNAWQWHEDDSILNILPLHHVHGIINVMSCALYVGARCEFLPKFDAEKVWSIFQSGRLNLFMAVPTIYYKLIKYWDSQNEETKAKFSKSFDNFRFMVSGSAALPVPTLEKWLDISGHTLLERYGMTEIGMALSNPYDGERRPGHVGLPLPNVQVRLVNEQGVVDGENEVGEIQVKGPCVFLEYWQKEEATRKSFTEDGWFITGDISIVSNGYYKILGRNSVDIIKSGGYKISALEIESVLLTHPEINECAVVGIPDDEWGEVVTAYLVSDMKQVDNQQLRKWCEDKLPSYKIPRKYHLIDELPKNTLGKVTKNVLKGK